MPGLLGERGLPDAGRQAGSRRVQFLIRAVHRVAVEDRAERVERAQVAGFLPPSGSVSRSIPRAAEIGGLPAVRDAELEPPGGRARRAPRRPRRPGPPSPAAVARPRSRAGSARCGPRGTEKRERRRQPAGKAEPRGAARPAELVRAHPGGIEAQLLGAGEQVERLAVHGRLVPVLAQVGVDGDAEPRHRASRKCPRRVAAVYSVRCSPRACRIGTTWSVNCSAIRAASSAAG